jgi:SAM-dependent methyltransferase
MREAMKPTSRPPFVTAADWEAAYRAGTPPWDTGKPHVELVRVLDEGHFRSGTVLELGCGTGTDAVYLARRRFEVTAVDCSAIALERARLRAEQHDAVLRFVFDDAFEFARTSGPFDVVYDAGFYHFMRLVNLEGYLDMLWRVTRSGSYFFCLAGAAGDAAEGSPPQIGEDDIHEELTRLFELVQLRPAQLEGLSRPDGYLAWSCLMRRPMTIGK